MNYGQIISQAWQILKRTKMLWLFGLILFLRNFINLRNIRDTGLACIFLIVAFLYFFLLSFYEVGIVFCVDQAIQEKSTSVKGIWNAYKSNLSRWILLSIVSIIPIGVIFFCALLSLVPINALSNNAISDTQTRILLTTLIAGPIFNGIYTFSLYGLLLHKLGILKSIRHGLSVFTMNWFRFIVLSLMLDVPYYATYFIFWIIQLLFYGNHLSFINLYLETVKYPVNIGFVLLSAFVTFFSSIAFLIAYYQFIKNFDYPMLRQVTPKT